MDHIWILLLFQGMFGEGQVLTILYLIVDHLYDASLVLEDFSSWFRIPPIIKRLNSRSLWSSLRWSTMRKLSGSSVSNIGAFLKVQLEVIYFYVIKKR